MEFDALAQRELQGGRIAVLPAGGQPRLDLQGCVDRDEGVVHVVVDLAFDSLRRLERVEGAQLRLERNLEDAARLGRPGGTRGPTTATGTGRQEKGADDRNNESLHEHVLPTPQTGIVPPLCRKRA